MPAAATAKSDRLTVVAYAGDAKTLLAFDMPKRKTTRLAGFTIEVRPHGHTPYFLQNDLRFKTPADHAQVLTESANASINAPYHAFRWVHVPGSVHQGLKPFYGPYTYAVTPRYFDTKGSLQPLDQSLTVTVDVNVQPFQKGSISLSFTRGYTQSQAFVNHFGLKALIRPANNDLLYDTSQVSGTNAAGIQYTYIDEYEWLGFTARQRIFDLLNEVKANAALQLDVFAYDLNEPDLVSLLLDIAKLGRVRIILDSASLHHSKAKPKPEDVFEQKFLQVATGNAAIKRGHFKRYAHDKVMIISDANGARTVLTGSTNFSVTGLYVNSNHVVVFDDKKVAAKYSELFQTVWDGNVSEAAYLKSAFASETFGAGSTSITFAPHAPDFATEVLDGIVTRIEKESTKARGNVLFAVMQIDQGTSPVYSALNAIHADESVFSYGISDGPQGIALYSPGRKTGVLVTGKPVRVRLPPPFNQVPSIDAVHHQIHHKFVVCGFNGADPVVYCGSSNLAQGGEESNGDNLLEIHDADVVTAFAIEAFALVDHFQFLNRSSRGKKKTGAPPASNRQAADSAGWFLATTDRWVAPYYDPNDLHSVIRRLLA